MKTKNQFTFGGAKAPLPIRWINRLAGISRPAFDRLALLKFENILEAAERRTGLQDWGDLRFKDALAALLDSVNQEGRLTFFGRLTLRQFLIGNLGNRLRMFEVLKHFPEIQQQRIQNPLFITGWYRTGTTHLHSLLASHPNVRAPLFWELRHPCPTLDPRSADPRRQIRKVRIESRIQAWLTPGFSSVHPLEAERPEECLHLFDKACAGTTPFFISEAKSFAWWLLDHGIQQGYHLFKIQLQLLNWLRPGRQWVLKWPYHLWHLDTLLKTFPDAIIVHLHRDPGRAIPSVCSLAALARASFCESIDNTALGKFWLDYYEVGLDRAFRARENINANQIIDIRYSDLKQDPLSVIKRIQNKIDMKESDTWADLLEIKSNAVRKMGPQRHQYAGEQFALDSAEILRRFSEYIKDYDLLA
jgi:hypothetical protein